MSSSLNAQIDQQLRWRYATKEFDPAKKISAADWKTLEESMVLAPSSYGLQPWKFVVVTTQSIKDQLPAAAWGQTQPKDCSHFVVIATRKAMDHAFVDKFMQSIADTRGVDVSSLSGYRQAVVSKADAMGINQIHWNSRQCYIALGFLLETAALLGIDACPMEGIVATEIDKLLGLTGTDYTSVVACALGYRAAGDKYASQQKVRFATGEIVVNV